MTISRRKNKPVAKQEENSGGSSSRAAESGVQYHCDVCGLDISSTVRISCATCFPPGASDSYDVCCSCFLEGQESGTHKAWHDYRVVEQHAYPIFCDDWGADEELLLIDGAQIYGLGNWADIADHIGNRTKEEVQEHYIKVFVEGRDGTEYGDRRAEEAVTSAIQSAQPPDAQGKRKLLPVVGPNPDFKASVDAEEFQKRKRQRIEDARSGQAAFGGSAPSTQTQGGKPVPPKPLVSAPTSHSELATFMPGRLEFEVEYENDAENYVKDMEFGKVYRYGGEIIPSEMEALGRKADQGRVRMEGSGRGGPGLSGRGNKGTKEEDTEGGDTTMGDQEKEDEDGDQDETKDGDETRDEDGQDDERDDDDDNTQDQDNDQSQMDATVDGGDTGDTTNAAEATNGTVPSVAASAPADTDDRAADWDEEEADLELKLMVLDIYNERLDRRGRRKEFIFERNLVDYKRTVAAERRRPKEERELLNRVRHFAQMQTAMDFEDFYNGLCFEDALRRAAAQLQMYRRAGITNLTEAAKFDTEQAERARRAAVAAEGGFAAFPAIGSVPRSAAGRAAARETATPDGSENSIQLPTAAAVAAPPKKKANNTASQSSTATPADGEKKAARKPPKPLDLSSHPSLNLLTRAEQELCSVVRIQPQVFMLMKKDIIVEFVRRKGKFSRRESRQLFKCDVNKVGKVYDLLESEGYLREANRLGPNWDGTGTPPGWTAPPASEKPNGEGKVNGASTNSPAPSQSLLRNGSNTNNGPSNTNSPRSQNTIGQSGSNGISPKSSSATNPSNGQPRPSVDRPTAST
ncbi:uncharacterized protein FA14DRAFT_160620 [Meira miltonrushii]|uniref:Transcriptional adapter 2 n=1 Tax=Meira miltonrushii TaxID=1280837 RepID=A0A316VGP9_9BASI|nr:uncharacterized protein FA14DRAFT_160620 [Meira miltonrushii]PWN35493.1 hypothetical protein FA14DRAFT_160620 [Meira miltonrushii]